MKIDWAALGSVFGVSLVVTVALVTLFTLGIAGLSRREAAATRGERAVAATAGAYTCFALCAAAVAYGIYLIVG
ncbi:hypothetical protein [Streptomyces thermodiastaticus]|jgi:hypothetical protein|uniref:hypothetical protein n=1 Tax=Streptomyces thermodiastaticus TaxID=44061 RepID=UPI00167A10CE|nr:hypothetical protein [Streptomyces thermodiastaticus]MCE7551518.1 hypothetical protein [Streptomyces thermodiastaticus]GHF64062.1 hypothetical protein GCM10018787_10370 [Streptomyces thermodiastaticus]